MSLGLGLGLLVAVAVIDRALMVELSGNLHAEAPSYYFLDVDAKDLDAFRSTALAIEPAAKLADAPMLRGRIVAVKGVPAEKVDASPEQRWVLAGDRGLTYTDTVPEGSKLLAGEWWPKGYAGEPLVSFDAEAAEGLGLKVGDAITVNILGRNVEARVASLRQIDWELLAINFIMVFSPNTLADAPHRVLTTLELPKGATPAEEGKLIQALAEALPPRHRHQGRRSGDGRARAHRQGDDGDPRDRRRHAVHRRRRAGERHRRGPAAPEIPRGAL